MRGTSRLISLIARVDCRSEHTAEERPVAVWLGTDRFTVTEIVDDKVVGPTDAGAPSERRVEVRLSNADLLILQRSLPDGEWRVFRRNHGG
jgi:hypothetical protein